MKRAGISAIDLQVVEGQRPFQGIPGHEFVGVVSRGAPAREGKRVVVEPVCVCRTCDMCLSGLSSHCRARRVIGVQGRDGGFAELVAVPERNLYELPAAVDDDQAVFVHLIAAALQVTLQCPIDARMKVSVVGSGRLGIVLGQILASMGCRPTVIGRNTDTLEYLEKKGIQTVPTTDLVARADQDVVVECSGSPQGLETALRLVRPRGTLLLKSVYWDCTTALAGMIPLVESEVKLLGSRSAGLAEAISILAREAIDVRTMISRVFPLEKAVEAFDAARDPRNIKVLLHVDAR